MEVILNEARKAILENTLSKNVTFQIENDPDVIEDEEAEEEKWAGVNLTESLVESKGEENEKMAEFNSMDKENERPTTNKKRKNVRNCKVVGEIKRKFNAGYE